MSNSRPTPTVASDGVDLWERLRHQALKDPAGQGAHQDDPHPLVFGLPDHARIVVPVARMLVHQVIAHLHRVKLAGSDQCLHARRRPFGREPQEPHLALVAQFLELGQAAAVQEQLRGRVLERPLAMVATMILFGLIQKRKVDVRADTKPLKLRKLKVGSDLRYEEDYMGAITGDGTLDEGLLRRGLVRRRARRLAGDRGLGARLRGNRPGHPDR